MTRTARAASATVRAAALPCSAARRPTNEGAGRAGLARRAARLLAVNQPSPTQAVAAARPNPIQPSARLWTSVKPSQKASPMMPPVGWANSTSDRAGRTGAWRAATREGGSQRSRAARRVARREGEPSAVRTAGAAVALAFAPVAAFAAVAFAAVAGAAGCLAGVGCAVGDGCAAGPAGRARLRLLVNSR